MTTEYSLRSSGSVPAEGTNNKINVSIKDFDGSQNISFFLDNIRTLKKLNNMPNEAALLYLKSKLSGSALEFFINSIDCQKAKSFEEACDILFDFYKPENSATTNLFAFQQIALQPGETIKNLGHRIDTLAQKAYTSVKDSNALNQIKCFQFLQAIPANLRKNVIHERQNDFKNLVEKTSLFASNINTLNSFTNNEVFETINYTSSASSLEEKVNFLTKQINDFHNLCSLCKQKHNLADCPTFNSMLNRKPDCVDIMKCNFCSESGHNINDCKKYVESNANYASYNKQNLCCHYCGGNHIMMNCFKFKNVSKGANNFHYDKNNKTNYNLRYKPYNKDYNGRNKFNGDKQGRSNGKFNSLNSQRD